jgi:hypothetical protein
MLEPLEFSCRIQGLEQPRVTPNLDLDAMPDARLWEMGAVPEILRMELKNSETVLLAICSGR